MGEILKAKHELEYVAFLNIKINTQEGFGYIFLAVDAFSGFVINLNVEHDNGPQAILKNVYALTENPDFINLNNNGFTLVFEDNEDLFERIESIITLVNGKVMFNKTYNNHISNPVLSGLLKLFKKSGSDI